MRIITVKKNCLKCGKEQSITVAAEKENSVGVMCKDCGPKDYDEMEMDFLQNEGVLGDKQYETYGAYRKARLGKKNILPTDYDATMDLP